MAADPTRSHPCCDYSRPGGTHPAGSGGTRGPHRWTQFREAPCVRWSAPWFGCWRSFSRWAWALSRSLPLGAASLTSSAERLRVSAVFVAFEAGVPLIGLAADGGLARVIGGVADYVAAAAVAGSASSGWFTTTQRRNGKQADSECARICDPRPRPQHQPRRIRHRLQRRLGPASPQSGLSSRSPSWP